MTTFCVFGVDAVAAKTGVSDDGLTWWSFQWPVILWFACATGAIAMVGATVAVGNGFFDEVAPRRAAIGEMVKSSKS